MKVGIVQFPGTNCEYDTQYAFEKLGASTQILWHRETEIPDDIELVVIAGGFSYGDYLRSGAIASKAPIMKAVKAHAEAGKKVLGICNGFQVLTETHLLPGALKRNEHLHFISKHHHLKVVSNRNDFLSKFEKSDVVNIPIAHHDGNFFIDDEGLKELYANEQVLTRISEIKVWMTSDPYPSSSSNAALDAFTNRVTNFNGNLAHLVSTVPAGNGHAELRRPT